MSFVYLRKNMEYVDIAKNTLSFHFIAVLFACKRRAFVAFSEA